MIPAALAALFACQSPAHAGDATTPPLKNGDAALASELRSAAVPIAPAAFTPDGLQVRPISDAMAQARIVGLGEGSHGTSQFYSIKDRLFRYLAQHDGFKVLAMEGDWFEWIAIDDYIHGGTGTARAVVNGQDFSIYRTREMQTWVEWLHAYNAGVPPQKQISVVGIDFQEPVKTFDFVDNYLRAKMPAVDKVLSAARPCFTAGATELSGATVRGCDDALAAVNERLTQRDAGSMQDRQVAETISVLRHAEPLLEHWSLAARDRMLANNVEWIAESVFPNERIAISAHDGHVCAYTCWQTTTTMGAELRQRFGTGYYALGMTFGSGYVRAHTLSGSPFVPVKIDASSKNTTAELFNAIAAPFFLNLETIPSDSVLGQWLRTPQTLWMPGGVVPPSNVAASALGKLSLTRAFDGIIFLPQSQPTTELDPAR